MGRFLFSTIIYIFIIIFLWVKKQLFNWTTVGWAFYSVPMKSKKMEGWPDITGTSVRSKSLFLMVKTKEVKLVSLSLSALVCTHLIYSAHHPGWMLVGFQRDGDAFQRSSFLGFSRGVAASQCFWMNLPPPVLPCTALPKPAASGAGQRSCIHCRGAKALLFPFLHCSSAASRVRRVGLSEEGAARLFWKVAWCRGHPAVTAVTIHASAFPHSWGEWPSLAVTGGDFSLLQSPAVTVRLQISQGGLGWVLLLFWQHLLFSSLNAASVPACPLCTLLSCPIHSLQRMEKESRARKELLSARAAPGESQCCQPGLGSGRWGLKGCHGV